jgi:signal transduction histidine kinase
MPNEWPADLIPRFAHDLREPLRSIVMQAQRIQRQTEPVSEETRGKLDEIIAAAKRQEQLIAAMLEYDQAGEEGAAAWEMTLPLPVAIQGACRKLEKYREQCGGSVAFDAALTPAAPGPAWLAKVVEKVLHNALRFHRSGAAPVVRIEGEWNGEEIVVRVVDRGIGIEAKYRESIFTPFRRLHAVHEYPGSGLSLATCRRLLGAAGGRIEVEDGGEETVFRIHLPVARTG